MKNEKFWRSFVVEEKVSFSDFFELSKYILSYHFLLGTSRSIRAEDIAQVANLQTQLISVLKLQLELSKSFWKVSQRYEAGKKRFARVVFRQQNFRTKYKFQRRSATDELVSDIFYNIIVAAWCNSHRWIFELNACGSTDVFKQSSRRNKLNSEELNFFKEIPEFQLNVTN